MPTTPDIYSGETGDGKFNIIGDSNDERSRLLSNFSNTPLFLQGEYFASMEGFIQGIVSKARLVGELVYESGGREKLTLPRRKGHWD